jgi:hypothetical protein
MISEQVNLAKINHILPETIKLPVHGMVTKSNVTKTERTQALSQYIQALTRDPAGFLTKCSESVGGGNFIVGSLIIIY